MYTLLIVDDEPLIRNGVKNSINWDTLGFSQIFLAEDGQEALEIVKTHKIDLVLTDIVMPFMDGLELSRILARDYPDIHVVILTGHEDFEYAQQSIALGVRNYILKPVGAESLYQQMKEICEKLHIENREKQYIADMKVQLYHSIPALREQMLTRIVCNPGSVTGNQYLERLEGLDIHLSQGPFEIGLIDLDDFPNNVSDQDLYLFAVKNIVQECVGNHHYVFEDGRDRLAILFCGNYMGEREEISENVYMLLEILQKTIFQNIAVKTTCAAGRIAEQADQLNASYLGARKALECKYSLGSDSVYDYRDLDYIEKSFYYPKGEIHELVSCIRSGSEKQICEVVHGIMNFTGLDKPLSPVNMQMNYISAMTALLRELSEIKEPSESIWEQGMDIFRSVNQQKTPADLEQRLSEFAESICRELKQVQKNSSQQLTDRVKDYIEQNYSDPELSLSTISEQVCVSTGYLSSLFKKETGINLVKYLMDIRIEKSKELLLTTDKRTYEIAFDTGFGDAHYFSIAFKKHTGMTPSEFRTRE